MSTADWEKILLAFGYLTSFDKYSDSDWSSDGYAEYLCNTCNAGFASITQLKVHATPSNSTATNCKLVFVKQRISQLDNRISSVGAGKSAAKKCCRDILGGCG
eukprot:12446_1